MYGSFGTVTFELLNSPQSFKASKGYHYEVIPVINGRPQVQWIYDELEAISLSFLFHQQFTDPESAIETLEQLADTHQAQALVFGTGASQGNFVITKLEEEDIWRSDAGDIIAVSMSMELLEFSGALPTGAPSDIAELTPGIIGSTPQAPTPIYSGATSATPPSLPNPVPGMPSSTFAPGQPLFPTIPILPYIPSVGGVSVSTDFQSVSLSVATRWGT